ncbi:GTP-binding protein HflX [Octadecabacter temperatus]|uniref:GTPase HflX n=1 Tax=Octadecabacter temperatus TaxID=1458307 RepID=A0A0K0Y577_9RHOB|nr:GTPase HflX [Octadecabacter temperatus]AKS45987.1 GTPase HflX [Octadecabacter temperatus]SIO05061.1 GTP-binding protein HflX [Octadecabacter temperatus]
MGEERSATRAFVLHPEIKSNQTRRHAASALEEGMSLARALPELELVGGQVVSLPKVHAGKLFGKGKIAEIDQWLKDAEAGLVLIDGHVSPVQQRNLEKEWGVKLLDRTGLILEIFSDRARTREGVLQVEMAALTYQRTRLVRAWTHLERQRGGLGFVGGPGETQIEADRRAIDIQLNNLKKQLSKVVKTRELHRKARAKVPYPIVALVGYTNAGKSTLFNRLTGADVFAKDMLFATLDPTMRRVELPSGEDVIMSDTVGFISELPTQLVASFRATLEEVLEADIILHVRDVSHPQSAEQKKAVLDTLRQLDVNPDVPMIEVLNKVDLLSEEDAGYLQALNKDDEGVFAISAVTGEGLDRLLGTVSEILKGSTRTMTLSLDWAQGAAQSWLQREGVIVDDKQTETGWTIDVRWSAIQQAQFEKQFPDAMPTVEADKSDKDEDAPSGEYHPLD